MIRLSLDASTKSTGWAIFDEDKLVTYGVIKAKSSDWRERICEQTPIISKIISKYKPVKIYVEDIPLMNKRGNLTLVQLGAVQGNIIGIAYTLNVPVVFLTPSDWRKKVGLYDGTKEGTQRDKLKQHSIEKVNKLFGLNLKWVSPSSKFNQDDEADAILICYSQVKPAFLGKRKGG